MNLIEYLERQIAFSERTFGPGLRTKMVLDHIRKELAEVESAPTDLEEWIDVVMLALDGAWRAGYTPQQIAEQLTAKLAKNEARTWPDWRTAEPDKAIEHVRDDDFVRELLEQDERDRQFLAEHGPGTMELLAHADRLIAAAKQ